MPIDSTADLLFRIGANTDDAEENVRRFRALFGTSLGEMGEQFHDWATEILGDFSTVKGALIGGGALLATGLVAAAGAALEAAHKYSEYVDEVARGSRVTGLSAENMSRLKFAADATHVSYESLVQGLTRFTYSIVQANAGSTQYAQAFERLGITQAQLKAGEKDMLPLLEQVADRFKATGSAVERTAMARELFSRGGPELIALLSQGSEGMKKLFEEADKLGLTLGTKDVEANEEYKNSLHLLKAEMESMAVTVGRIVLPILTSAAAHILGFIEAEQEMAHTQAGFWDYATLGVATWVKAFGLAGEKAKEVEDRIKELAESLAKFGGEGETGGLADVAKDAKEQWQGLSAVLYKIREDTYAGPGKQDQLTKQMNDLAAEIDKATKKYNELRAAGKLTAEDAAAEGKALAALPAAMDALIAKFAAEVQKATDDARTKIQGELIGQGPEGEAKARAQWAMKMAAMRAEMAEQKTLTAENLAYLDMLEKAGYEKIARDRAQAIDEGAAQIAAKGRAQAEKTRAQELVDWAQEIADLRAQMAKKETLTAENAAQLAAVEKAGAEKINRAWDAKYAEEMAGLQRHLAGMLEQEMTHAQRLQSAYEKDAAEFSAAEEKKVLATAKSEAERAAIEAQFAALRSELAKRYQADLQELQNSQGWQGVFGGRFAEAIKGNEALSKEWATSENQSLLLVKVAMEALSEMGQRAFEQMAEGMGSNIAHAMVYGGSIEKAMKQALAATLESIAAQAMVQAIYATALGFLDLAEGNFAGAGAAFTAAAIFGSVGVAAAVAGHAVAGGTQGAGGAGGSASGSASANGGGQSAEGEARSKDAGNGFQVGGTAANPGTHVTVNVWGHVVGTNGVEQLAGMLNDAVLNKDVTLTATNTKTGVQVTR